MDSLRAESLQRREGASVPQSAQAPGELFLPRHLAGVRSPGTAPQRGTVGPLDPTLCGHSGDGLRHSRDPYTVGCYSYPPTIPAWDEITGIQFVKFGDFYDLTVPGHEHYEADGLWHHNSGKSFTLCKRMISLALENAPAPVAIVSPTYPMAKKTVIQTIRELLSGKATLLPGFSWSEIKTAPHEFRIKYQGNEAEIYIYSGENPDRLKGPNLAAAGIDEPFMQDKAVFEQMLARIRDPRAKRMELNCTGTPEQLNWGYELVEGNMRKDYDVGFVRAPTRSNFVLDAKYLERLESGYDAKTAQAYLDGDFVSLAKGAVFPAFDPDENVLRIERPDYSTMFAGMDFNVCPMTFVVGWVLGADDSGTAHVHIIDEYEVENSDSDEAGSILRADYWDQGLRTIFPDSNVGRSTGSPGGVTDYDHLKRHGFDLVTYPGGNPPLRDRWNTVNGMFRSRRGGIRFTIDPRCEKLKRYFSTYSHEKKLKASQLPMSHLIDAATYPISTMFGPKSGRAGLASMSV